MKHFLIAIKIFLFMTILCGLVYPAVVTGLGRMLFPTLAVGDTLERDGRMVGARAIGQRFATDTYFWGRPSAIDYNPLSSGGSNLGPTSEALRKAVAERRALVAAAHGLGPDDAVPQDLLFASASGLDPDIAAATAWFQLKRVVKARGLSQDQTRSLEALIASATRPPDLGFLGEARVNVLELNLSLDRLAGSTNASVGGAGVPTKPEASGK